LQLYVLLLGHLYFPLFRQAEVKIMLKFNY